MVMFASVLRKVGCIITALCHNALAERAISQQGLWNDTLTTGSEKIQSWLGCFCETEEIGPVSVENSWIHEGWAKEEIFMLQLQVTLFQRTELGRLITQNTFRANPFLYIKPWSFLSLFFPTGLSFQFFLSLSFSVSLPELSCFVPCWAFTTGQFPHQSKQLLNKHQQNMSEGACE